MKSKLVQVLVSSEIHYVGAASSRISLCLYYVLQMCVVLRYSYRAEKYIGEKGLLNRPHQLCVFGLHCY